MPTNPVFTHEDDLEDKGGGKDDKPDDTTQTLPSTPGASTSGGHRHGEQHAESTQTPEEQLLESKADSLYTRLEDKLGLGPPNAKHYV